MANRSPIIFLLAALAVAGCSKSDQNEKAAASIGGVTLTADQQKNIHLFTVSQTAFHKTIETNGIVDFDHDLSTSVLAPISGPVSRLLAAQGERVTKSEPLAIVASPDYAQAVTAYRKALTAARTARRVADLDKDLLAHQGVSAREADQAESDAVGAESDSAAARQAIVALDVDQETINNIEHGRPVGRIEGPIRAPIAGTLVERLITPGQLLQAGTTACFTIADLSRVWVMAQLFGSDSANINVGDSARIEYGTNSTSLSGRVENVSTQVDPNTLAVGVRVVVDNPGNLLKRQMYVRVSIEDKRESRGILVPASAILHDDENLPFVYIAERDGSFGRGHVTLGARTGDSYVIAAGLRPGERIVADGALFLQFMQDQ